MDATQCASQEETLGSDQTFSDIHADQSLLAIIIQAPLPNLMKLPVAVCKNVMFIGNQNWGAVCVFLCGFLCIYYNVLLAGAIKFTF